MSYDYEAYLAPSREVVKRIVGLRLEAVLVDFVEPEANVVYLLTADGSVVIDGAIGGEILRVAPLAASIEELKECGLDIREYQPFSEFVGHRIAGIREIGAPWNGHGWEIGFDGLPETTMLVQSIYTDPKPEGFDDCLRLGVGRYQWNLPNKPAAPNAGIASQLTI